MLLIEPVANTGQNLVGVRHPKRGQPLELGRREKASAKSTHIEKPVKLAIVITQDRLLLVFVIVRLFPDKRQSRVCLDARRHGVRG